MELKMVVLWFVGVSIAAVIVGIIIDHYITKKEIASKHKWEEEEKEKSAKFYKEEAKKRREIDIKQQNDVGAIKRERDLRYKQREYAAKQEGYTANERAHIRAQQESIASLTDADIDNMQMGNRLATFPDLDDSPSRSSSGRSSSSRDDSDSSSSSSSCSSSSSSGGDSGSCGGD